MIPETNIDHTGAGEPERPATDRIGAVPARLIGLDWGTSSLRAWLFGENGQVLDRREAPLGILAVRNTDFAQAFESSCASWQEARPGLPVIAAGMIGSRQGWREAPYLETPTGFDALVQGLLVLDDAAGRPFRIVPGLLARLPGRSPDVLRGEETQVFGALASAAPTTLVAPVAPVAPIAPIAPAALAGDRARGEAGVRGQTDIGDAETERLFVLPGTHSKWVAVRGATITGFRSYMTGELYAVMREHSILGRLCVEPDERDGTGPLASFDDGVERGFDQPGSFAHLLFTVRTEALLGIRPADELSSYLSGLLIGAEIADALRVSEAAGEQSGARRSLTIIAAPALAARYLRARQRTGFAAGVAAGEPASAGLYAIAARARLIS
jgi:2-dehydro-3-deoxygalactonokinase